MVTLPLLSTQQGIWFADQVGSAANAYAIAHTIELRGEIDLACMQQAIRTGLAEADTVMARYVENEAGPWQELRGGDTETVPEPELLDLTARQDARAAAERFMADDLRGDLRVPSDQCLFRHVLIDCGHVDGERLWLWYQRYHHIMLDGFSFTALTRRIAEIYSDLTNGDDLSPSPFCPVADVIEEEKAYLSSSRMERDRLFWTEYCRDLPPDLSLSSSDEGTASESMAGVIAHLHRLPPESLPLVQQKAETRGVEIFDLLLATVTAYLHRLSGETDQVVGVPFMRRMGSVAIRSTAPVVNVLPVRVAVDPTASLIALAQSISVNLRQVRKHQRYDAERIRRDLGLVGSSRELYGPVVNYRMFDYDVRLGSIVGQTHHLATGPVDDIEFGLLIRDGRITFELRANAQRYADDDLKRHGVRLETLLDAFLADEAASIGALPATGSEERDLLARVSTGPEVETPGALRSIVDVFARQAAKTPNRVALVHEETVLSFGELSGAVSRLARHIIAWQVGPGDTVAVALPRSDETVVAMLAVLTSGAAYMPLDLDYPPERLTMMCEDAAPKLILTVAAEAQGLPDGPQRICLDDAETRAAIEKREASALRPDERKAPLSTDTTAYIIFTSGSTGRPKGVMNTHGALLNLFLSHMPTIYAPGLKAVEEKHPGRALRAAHTHSFAFDSSWLQIFWMLHGQELHVFGEDLRRDAEHVVEAVAARRIDAMDLPPSFCAQAINCGLLETGAHQLSVLLVGGEAVSLTLWDTLRRYPQVQAHNLYGPTEYTVDALHAPLTCSNRPVIGRPIGNTVAHVLDDRLRTVPIGVVGDLYLSGSGLAQGYLGRPALTAERFVANPFCAGQRMYRTGDRVRWNGAGQVEFLGRSDHQIKVRGYRIETTEIEAALQRLDGVCEALVVAEAVHDSHRLIAYCTVDDAATAAHTEDRSESLRHELRTHLPDYMIPSAFVTLDAFPLTVNGKIDRERLPAPSVSVRRAASTPEEVAICQAMADVLKLPAIGLEHDFFSLGGDSITAIMLCAALRSKGLGLRPRDVFSGRDALHMSALLQPLAKPEPDPVATQEWTNLVDEAALSARYGEVETVVPLLPTQKGLLFHAETGDQASAYNAYTRLDLVGPLDAPRLRQAFDDVLRRHPQLAGLFDTQFADEPLLVIPRLESDESHIWPWEEHDLSHLSASEQTAALHRLETLATERHHYGAGFRNLISATLIRLSGERHVLLIVVHHLMIDGWSTPILLRALFDGYEHPEGLTEPPADYAAVVRQLAARDTTSDRKAWEAALEGVVPTRLFDHISASGTVEECERALPADLTADLTARARQAGVTLNVLMQTVWGAVLGAMAGRDDVVFGTPVAGRSAPVDGIAEQIGLFLNTIPVRARLTPNLDLWNQAKTLQASQSVLMDHDGMGLGEIQSVAGGESLFDTLLVVENYPDNDYLARDFAGLSVRNVHNRGYSHYPLALLVLPGERLTLLIENRGAIDDAEALADRVVAILEALVRSPERTVASLVLQTSGERALIKQINATRHILPPITLRDLLMAQVGRTPDAIALVEDDLELTFQQVRHEVLHLAACLHRKGVGPGDIVAVALPRSARLSIAILATVEAGAAFLPLDLSYPSDRLAFMLSDASPKAVITDQASASLLAADELPAIVFEKIGEADAEVRDSSADSLITPDSPAYVLYTSGTTGRPKGAVISHRAIVNRILWMQDQYPLAPEDTVLQKTPCGFDVSVWEFFWSYIVGARLVMAPPDAHRDPSALIDLIDRHAVTTLHFVPSMLAIFLEEARDQSRSQSVCTTLRRVFCSGEALPKTLGRDFIRLFEAELHNLYGPTEAAIDVTFAPALGAHLEGDGNVPIGRPVWNTQLRILDHLLRPVPVGVAGELYLCGVQLADGYLGRPGLTASRFVADPFAQGERMYRTGDLTRWLPNGEVEYLGRTDHQIKIRGQRVELGEIEAQIEKLPGVSQAVVQPMQIGAASLDGADGRQLVAYLVSSHDEHLETEAIGEALRAVLPAHMLPTIFMPIESMPLSPNGKLDRKALPQPDISLEREKSRLPAEGLESQIAAIFAELLGREVIYAEDDFFAVGGHSLLAMRLAARIRRDLKRRISVGQIMLKPTVEKLAEDLVAGELVGRMAESGFDPVIRLRDGDGPPLICIYPASGVSWQYSVLSRYLRAGMPIVGLQSPRPNGPIAMSHTIDEACDRQLEILREVRPHGPYYLLGYSLGGTIAHGLAVRLRKLGETVRFLGLLDTYPAEEHDWSDPEGAQANLGAEREQEQFINEAMADVMDDDFRREKEEMFGHIFENYNDAVTLLSSATTPDYEGRLTLFAAGKSVPPGIDPDRCWLGRVGDLSVHRLPHCSHEDIMSPASLEILGPLIDTLIREAIEADDGDTSQHAPVKRNTTGTPQTRTLP
ncbi:non-ribosomal peptide synthetase [Notoacmeibacter ruber]|uniref:Amino acid adenylation domain-containing protein n=1 Tax=Notoacmeibacter ruber TaxID=2670375 RepID=A0A3L7JD07_9HYPH|nr:non-ribosomal peptide synthetase [Notoacmeibacter ruber]RLQ88556.1 amino acid adenylation domain-containing protein [Notoacmeibacter ruber]